MAPFMASLDAPNPRANPTKQTGFEAALAELDAAEAWSDRHDGPDVSERLTRAIADILQYDAEIVADPQARESLLFARLSLARNYYIMDPPDPASGDAVIESTLRWSTTIEPKIMARFRPYFGERLDAIKLTLDSEGTGTIEVVCHVACDVAVNHQRLDTERHTVYLGTHTVLLVARDGSLPAEVREVTISSRAQVETLVFGEPPVANAEVEPSPVATVCPPPKLEPPPEPAPPAPARTKPMAPLWLEIAGVVVGSGLIATGIAASTYQDKCRDPSDSILECERVWEARPASSISIGLGGAVLATSTLLLIVDRRRHGRRSPPRVALTPNGALRF